MISKIKKYLTVALLSMFTTVVVAQIDPHFSQYYMYPLWLNPALTGAVDGNFRASVIQRQQWGSITTPFNTVGLSADMPTKKNINFGINILQQDAGTVGYKYSNGDLSVSYSGIRFGKEGDKVVSFGMQGGFIGRRINLSDAQVNDQYQGGVYNPGIPIDESVVKPSAYSFDLGAGLFYYDADPDKKVNLFAGFSAGHLTQPSDPFLSSNNGAKLPIRYTAHAGANIYLSDRAQLVPNVLYMQQGNSTEIMFGGYLQMALNETTDITGGVNYRINDAVAPYIGLKLSSFTFGFSYDVNSSQLGKLVNGASGFDLSLMYTDSKKQKGNFKCPRY
jgi:type IX secretion system PorP/SprF family membrane protein